ncbi:hypothetical protein [Peribacillus sp. NPDC097295]
MSTIMVALIYVADQRINCDLFDGTTDELLTAKALKTVVAGRVVFEREK